MKKAAVIILAVFGVVFGTGLSASAGYPPGTTPTISVGSSSVAPGGSVPVTVSGLKPGATVSIQFNGKAYTATVDASGKATVSLTAPTAPGKYDITIPGSQAKAVTITVTGDTTVTTAAPTTPAPTTKPPVGTTPATGSSTTITGAAIGVPLLVGGLALLLVSRRRRPVIS